MRCLNATLRYTVYLTTLLTLLLKEGECIKCTICEASRHVDGSDCLVRPPPPQTCDESLNHCIVVAKYSSNDVLQSYTRSCSPFALPDSCIEGADKGTGERVNICYTTCSRDGCNSATTLHHLLDLLRRKRK